MHEQIEFQFIEDKAGKACHKCGEDIVGKAISQIYCSKECREGVWRKDSRRRANKKPIKDRNGKTCPTCGKEVVGHATKVYCSKKCSKKARRGTDAYKAQKARWRKSWKRRNPAKAKAQKAKWRKGWESRNPVKAREQSKARKHRRRARLKNNGIEDTSDYRARMTHPLVRQVCFYCGKDCTGNFHWDHRIPIAAGGPDAEWNLVISCPPCNLKKGAKVPKTLFAEEIFKEP